VTAAAWLLGHGAAVDVRDREWMTPLHHAVWLRHPPLVATLLEAGADPHAADVYEITAASRARETGHADTIRLFPAT
jgi:ankyrin repeat protein